MVSELAIEHLRLRLRPINRALRDAVARQAQAAARLARPDVVPLCVTDDQVQTLLDAADELLLSGATGGETAFLTDEETILEEDLRARSESDVFSLPLDAIREKLSLTSFEIESILLCAAPEIDRAYERVYAYILDDLNLRFPCAELLSTLTASTLEERLARRNALSQAGRLRRTGLIEARGDQPFGLRQELRLAPGVLEFLTSTGGREISLYHDPAEVRLPSPGSLPPGADRLAIEHAAEALQDGRVSVLSIYGPRQSNIDETVLAVAARTAKPLRLFSIGDCQQCAQTFQNRLREALQTASGLNASLWIPTSRIEEPVNEFAVTALENTLPLSTVPVIFSGEHPWRPIKILAARSYAEIELKPLSFEGRKTAWTAAIPEADQAQLEDLAARFRVNAAEVSAAAMLARTESKIAGNGRPSHPPEHLENACAIVTRKRSHRFATLVTPKRGPRDLILPAEVHRQVMEVASFFRAWPRVSEGWGFNRMITGEGGIKALFSGDSGTGKTLAAEVIAGELRMPLLKVDLARVVSKWVGETEKQLEAAFHEAEDSHAILFFDEADALFGKRGEVQHGVDRYANLEVSYLLQRLEDHYGLVILASNLRDNLDAAFTRRFQIVIHFPRPEPAERRRIWEISFPAETPRDGSIDFEALTKLDMTGAAISGAAQTAALLAAREARPLVTMSHTVRAVARQFQREARILTARDLGPYAALLHEAR